MCVCKFAVVDRLRVCWLEVDNLVQVLDGAVVFALFFLSEAAVVESLCVLRIKLDRPVIVLDGAVVFALGGV
jgi:hypothetical protein